VTGGDSTKFAKEGLLQEYLVNSANEVKEIDIHENTNLPYDHNKNVTYIHVIHNI